MQKTSHAGSTWGLYEATREPTSLQVWDADERQHHAGNAQRILPGEGL